MFVGNEYFFKPATPYRDENGRLHMKEPDWGQDIYMWWSIKEHVLSDGTVRPYKYFIFSKGGQREQYYCKPGELYPKNFIDRHMFDFFDNFTFYLGSLGAMAHFSYKPKKIKIKRKHGRPRAFESALYDLRPLGIWDQWL